MAFPSERCSMVYNGFVQCLHNFLWIDAANARQHTSAQDSDTVAFAPDLGFLSHLPILLPWSIDTAFLCAFLMMIGYFAKWVWAKKIFKIDLILLTIVGILLYRMLVQHDASANLSLRIYGSHGDQSIFEFALIGVTGTVFFTFLGFLALKVRCLRKILSYVCQSGFALMALQFELFDIWNTYMPPCQTEDRYQAYIYGCFEVVCVVLFCMAVTFFVNRILCVLGTRK